jgi:hypothetical protein
MVKVNRTATLKAMNKPTSTSSDGLAANGYGLKLNTALRKLTAIRNVRRYCTRQALYV